MALQQLYAGFPNEQTALAHRSMQGGWVFAADTGEAVWFSLKFTPSTILPHRAISGLSGKLL